MIKFVAYLRDHPVSYHENRVASENNRGGIGLGIKISEAAIPEWFRESNLLLREELSLSREVSKNEESKNSKKSGFDIQKAKAFSYISSLVYFPERTVPNFTVILKGTDTPKHGPTFCALTLIFTLWLKGSQTTSSLSRR